MTMRAAAMFVLGGGIAAAWQQPPETPFRISTEVRLVVLDVGVRNQQGVPVTGLPRTAFRVFDTGKEQPLASFAREDAPVSIGLVVDASGSMRSKRLQVISAATTFIEESNRDDETFLVTFNDTVKVGKPSPPVVLRQGVEDMVLEGRTALYDGIAAALEQLREGTRERKTLVIISDGGDNFSRLHRMELIRLAQLANATIYTVGITDTKGHDADPRFLSELARLTGGAAHTDIPAHDLPRVCKAIAHEIRSRYMLSFAAGEAFGTEIRPIRVDVRAPGAGRIRVFARPSYIATKATEASP